MINNQKPLAIIAKCALCSIKTELFVCSHCDEVICQICVDKHQPKQSEILKEQWNTCKTKYMQLSRFSDHFDKDMVNIEQEIDRIRVAIDQRYINLIQLIENEKKTLLNQIEEHFQVNLSYIKHAELQQLFTSIEKRIDEIFQNADISFNVDDFLLEIELLNQTIEKREKQIQENSFQYPSLIPGKPMSVSDIFGELQWNSKPMTNHSLIRPMNSMMNGDGGSMENADVLSEHSTNFSEDIIPMSANQRQKQWTTDAAGVPHFLCVLSKKNYLLFACDKFGSIDLYQLDSSQPRNIPRHLRQFELFPGNTTSQTPQIIETFTVYTPFIVISAHLADQTDTSSIYFFDHRGCQQGEICLQNFPVRQLSADVGFKYLWGVDRHQHSVYYNQLPTTVQQIPDFIKHREEFIKFNRDFEPIRITQNQTSIAVVERNSQSAHIFDKQTKKHIDEVENRLRTKGIYRLWNVLLRDDNSMILKLDEDLPPNSRPPSINHLILELDSKGVPVSQIERTSVYGLAIGPNDEILLGCKRHQQNGLIECYI